MRFASLRLDDRPRLCVVDGDCAVDLGAWFERAPSDLLDALRSDVVVADAGGAALASSAPRIPLAGAAAAPPIGRPGKVICLGLNYVDHADESGRPFPDYPWFFLRAATSLIGHGQPAWLPRASERFDFESELAVVIGSTVPRHVAAADALAHVFGYSCFNDMSVRDFQRRTPQWTIGKNFDATGAFGPVVVTADELPAGAAGLAIEGRLNGVAMQRADTSDMIFDVATTLAILAEVLTLEPGDVVVMGTPSGVGQARTPPMWMRAGDRFEVEIEGIGILSNPIVAEPDPVIASTGGTPR